MNQLGHEMVTGGAAITVAVLGLWAAAIAPLRENVDRLERDVRDLKEIIRTRSEETGALRERVGTLEEQERLREFEILHGKSGEVR